MSKKALTSRNFPALGITRRKLYVAMLAASQWMGAGNAMASPEGGVVVGGAGTIDQSGLETTIRQASDRMAIDWQSFDVKSNERVQFIQPKSTSVALNRVLSNKGSEILGRIDANGQVFLINPNGVVFGRDSQINVGGILASGLSIDPNKFMNGEFTLNALEGTEGKVINSGIINAATGGSVTLVGQQVKNEGLISANLGAVSLAAGKEAVVTFDRGGMLGVKVTKAVLQDELGVDAAVINSGEINAAGGQILLTASVSQDIFSDAVNHDGMNKETSVVVHEDGSFTLGAGADVVNTGTINASTEVGDAGQVVVLGNNITSTGNIQADAVAGTAGSIELHSTDTTSLEQNAKVTAAATNQGQGGDIKILGNRVGLFDAAEINASGANGGGQVLVGGDKTGSNNKIRNADFIYLGRDSAVKADGLVDGDGGKLITFASDTARIFGSLSARGGNEGGNGGFIETSGLKGFEIASAPDVRAVAGRAGEWLIDPFSIDIVSCSKTANDLCTGGDTQNIKGNGKNGVAFVSTNKATLDVVTLEEALAEGAKVTVETGVPSGNGTTTDVGDIKLLVNLPYHFTADGGNESDKEATLILKAHRDIIINGNIERAEVKVGNNIIKNNNRLNLEFIAGGDITLGKDNAVTINTNGGNITAVGKNFDSKNAIINNIGTRTSGSIFITSIGDATKENGAGTVAFGTVDANNLTVIGDSDDRPNTFVPANVNVTQNATANNGPQLTIKGTSNFNVGSGKVELIDSGNIFDGVISITSAKTVSLLSFPAVKLGASNISGDFNLTANGNISQVGTLNVAGTFTLTALQNASVINVALTDLENDFGTVATGVKSFVSFLRVTDKNNLNVGDVVIKSNGAAEDNIFSSSSDKGKIILNGKITNTNANSNVAAGKIRFNSDVYLEHPVTIDGGDITFAKNALGPAMGLNINGSGFTANNIVTGSLLDVAGGAVNVKVTGAVSIGNIETWAGNGAVGKAGGAVTISGNSVALEAINTSGSKGSADVAGGKAGAISITASSLIKLQGDMVAVDGASVVVAPEAVPALAPVPVQVTLSSAGIVDLTEVGFFTSLVNFTGGAGEDTLKGFNADGNWAITASNSGTLSQAGVTPPQTAKYITFTGFENLVGGSGSNSLTGLAGTNTWAVTGKDTVAVSGSALGKYISFSNIKNIKGGAGEDTFDFSAQEASNFQFAIADESALNTLIGRASGSNTWSVSEGANTLASNGVNYISSFSGIQTLTGGGSAIDIFNINKDFAGTINGGGGNDKFTISALVGAVSGGDGNDEFILNAALAGEISGDGGHDTFTLMKNLASTSTLSGGAGNDTFNIAFAAGRVLGGDGKDVFNIDAVAVSIAGEADDDSFNVNVPFANLISGGDGADTFNINAPVGKVFGGNGNDSFILGAGSSVADIYGNIEGALEVDENNSLTGRDAINVWKITGKHTGTVETIGFHDIQTLIGNDKKDTFGFSAGGTMLMVKGGSDSNNLMKGPDGLLVTWDITDKDAGSVTAGAGGGSSSGVTGFQNIQNLEGGTGNDTFNFMEVMDGNTVKSRGAITGLVNGGGGVGRNFLNGYKNANNSWSISSAGNNDSVKRTGVDTSYATFSSIQELGGGSGTDYFVLAAKGRALIIYGGDNAEDKLEVTGSGPVKTFWDINEDSKGSTVNGITFFGIRKLQGDEANDEFVFHNDAKVNTLSVDGGGGENILNWKAVTTVVNELEFGSEKNKFSSIGKVVGNAALSFYAGAGDNDWTFTSNILGEVKTGGKSVEFEGFGKLRGGDGKDTFIFTDATIKINADAGDGTDIVDLRALTVDPKLEIDKTVMGISGINEVWGNTSKPFGLKVFGSDPTTWTISAKNTVTVENTNIQNIKFVDFDKLVGGTGLNTFKFVNQGEITSATSGGPNKLDLSEYSVDKPITLNGSAIMGVDKIGSVAGNAAKDFTLQAIDGENTWIVDGTNSGSFKNGGSTITFTDFKNLIGGVGKDSFEVKGSIQSIGSLVNTVIDADGNLVVDSLADTSLTGKTWEIFTKDNKVVGRVVGLVDEFSNIKVLQAGNGDDTFKVNATFAGAINGGDGNNEFEINAATGTLTGGSGKDTFILNDNGSAVLINGGDNLAGNTIEISNGEAKNTWNITAANAGDILNGENHKYASFVGIQNLQGGSTADIFNINANFSGAIHGNAGNDTFNVNAIVDELFGEAGDDEFVFSGDATSEQSTANAGVVKKNIDGGDGKDTIWGRNANTRWQLMADGNNRISTFVQFTDEVTAANTYVFDFDGIESFKGGSEKDIFQNRSQEVGLEFIGGAGAGVFMINNTSSTYVGSDIDDDEYVIDIDGSDGTKADTINGKGGTNTLFARDTHNTWKVTSDNKGTLTYTSETTGKTFVNSFENIQNLVGGGQQDEFTLSAAIGKVSGGAGDDTFTFTAKGSAKQIDGYGGAIEQMLPQTDIIVGRNAINIWTLSSINEGSVKVEGQDTSYASFSHIREIRGNDDTLIGANAKSTWSIKGAGTGTLSLTDNASQLLNFSGITNLTGNQAADKFTFLAGGKINGVIDGGSLAADAPAGLVVVDTLNVEELAQGVAINLSGLKETDRLAIKNIESITASSQSANKNFLYGSSEFESYSWIIDGENKGSVALTEPVSDKYKISFENFGNIQGGTQTDLFQLLDDGQIISIVGGDGAENIIDRMDYSLSKKNVEIVLGSNNSDSDDDEPAKTKINGVEGIKGNNDGSSPANTLVSSISAVGGHVWTLGSFDTTSDGINDGEVIVDGKKVSFENFNLILGGEGDDRFKFKADGQFIGTIKGLEGDDFFDASLSTKAQVVAINGKATGQTNLYTVETIVGNSMAESRLVGAAQENIWTLAATGVSKVGSSAEVISFSGFTRLVGGALADVFNLGNASEFSLLLDGGSATASTGFKDVVNIAGGNVGVGLTSTPGLRIINMDEVNATQASSASKLIADDAENTGNSWSVTGQNKGSLNTRLNFNGFANLTGGKAVDVFTFEGIAAAIDGVIDAGAGDDILNLDAIARDVSVHVVNTDNSALASHINIINLEDVTASAGHVNKFSASDLANTWVIDAKDTGTLNRSADSAGTKFTNFSYLLGGKGEDTFNFVAAGLISDNVDGGLGEGTKNKVNVSAATFADVALSQYKNIDEFTGNNTTSSLRGDVIDNGQAIDNKWTMGVEKNTGSVNQVAFVGFANLIGGDGKDTFEVLQGGLTGSIHGGLGDDRFSVAAGVVDGGMNGGLGDDTFDISIAAGSAQKNSFIGGDGTDTLAVRGGGADYNATHTSLAQWDGELTYKTLANEFTVLYSNMDVVNDEVIAATLTVKDTAIAEEFAFNGNGYSLRAPDSTDYVSTTINYANKTNLVVSASENDRVTFAGELNGVQSLSVQNALLASINAGLIRVNELKLNNIGNVGSAGDRLSLSVNNISVANATGDIYLKNDKGLVINEFSNNHLFDAALAGDLSNTQAMTSAGNFVIDSTANIHLTQDNLLSGDISLTGINVDLRNTGVTHLQHVKAQDLNVTAFGSIDGRGAIEVSGKAVFASNDSIDLLNADNHFNALSITSAASATITDKGLLTLSGLNAVGNVVINAGGILINGPVTIAGLQVNAGQNLAEINADIFAQESLNINATGITLNGKLSAADINLQGGAGDVKLNGLLDTSNKQAILVSGNNLVQNAKIVSGGDIVLQATGNLTQSADMDSAADILVSADGDLTLEANANTIGNQVRYLAGRAMTLLGNITGQNKVEVTAVTTLNQSGSVKSDDGDLTVATGQHVMSADAGLAATKGSVAVKSADDIIARNISANNDIVLQAADLVQIDKALTATLGTIKVVAENNVAVLGALSANKSINIDSVKGSIIQNESISNRSENITLVAGNNIVMNTAGVSTAEAGNVNYSGKNIALNLLNAKNGTVFLTATEGAITDINDSATNNAQLNIDARALDAMAVTGIGAGNKIETRVSEILLTNIAGNIDIGNSREVTIKQLRTNGSVDFANSQGHILLGNVTPPASAETPTRPVADNATYQIDVLTLKTDNGDLRAADGKNLASPEINANRAILTAGGGTIGVPNRPLVISSGYVVANSRRTWKPIFTRPGTSFVDESKTSASIADISATSHEQLVQVETLAEVNPAVFTAVRNYVYDEVAILLPEDQRYDAAEE